MGFSLNDAVKPQTIELNKKADVFSNDLSPTKRLYVDGDGKRFSKKDLVILLKNIGSIYKTPTSMIKTVKLIKRDKSGTTKKMSPELFGKLASMMDTLGVDALVFLRLRPSDYSKAVVCHINTPWFFLPLWIMKRLKKHRV